MKLGVELEYKFEREKLIPMMSVRLIDSRFENNKTFYYNEINSLVNLDQQCYLWLMNILF